MTGLPLSLRLRRAGLVALILGLWAPFKVVWEQHIAREQLLLRYHGVPLTVHLRDQLGQGLTFGVLSGMGNVVADFLWLDNVLSWEKKLWFNMLANINLCTTLQPRSITFWSIGGWQLAWNASVDEYHNPSEPNDLRRLKASQFWIEKGLDIYKHGLENNPEHYRLWADTGLLYQARLAEQERRRGQLAASARDYHQAAYYYAEAHKRPDCPIFYERFSAYMYEDAGDNEAAYAAWKDLWYRLTPAQKKEAQHDIGKVESSIRALENKLSIPKEKRVFPN